MSSVPDRDHDKRHILARVDLFKGLDDATLDRLTPGPELVYSGLAERGATAPRERDFVFHQGDPGDSLFAIVGGTGRLRLGVPDSESKRLMIEVLSIGDVFGELAALEDQPRTADAYADGQIRLARIPAPAFKSVLADTPQLGFNLAHLLASRLRRTFTLFQDASFETIEVRLARQLLYLAEREGRPVSGGVRLPGSIRQSDLADLLGTTSRSIISTLNKWRLSEWVYYDGNKSILTINQISKLRGLLDR